MNSVPVWQGSPRVGRGLPPRCCACRHPVEAGGVTNRARPAAALLRLASPRWGPRPPLRVPQGLTLAALGAVAGIEMYAAATKQLEEKDKHGY